MGEVVQEKYLRHESDGLACNRPAGNVRTVCHKHGLVEFEMPAIAVLGVESARMSESTVRRLKLIGAGIVVIALMWFKSTRTPDSTTSNIPEVSSPRMATVTPQTDHVPTYDVGEPFSVGNWSYICYGARWTPLIGSDPNSMERADASFLVIGIKAQNDHDSSSTLPTFRLMDERGLTYAESSKVTAKEGFLSASEQLNPGVSKRGNIAFDVPPSRHYALVFSGGIESGKRAIVIMPMSPSK